MFYRLYTGPRYRLLKSRELLRRFAVALLNGELTPSKPYQKRVSFCADPVSQFEMLAVITEKLSKGKYAVRHLDDSLIADRYPFVYALCQRDLLPAETQTNIHLSLDEKVEGMVAFEIGSGGVDAKCTQLLSDEQLARNRRRNSSESRARIARAWRESGPDFRATLDNLIWPRLKVKQESIKALARRQNGNRDLLESALELLQNAQSCHLEEKLRVYFLVERLLQHGLKKS